MALVTMRRLSLETPLCWVHRHYWPSRAAAHVLAYLWFFIGITGGFFLLLKFKAFDVGFEDNFAMEASHIIAACLGIGAIGIVPLLVVNKTNIQAAEIVRGLSVTLEGVSRAFIEELFEERERVRRS